MPLHAFIALPLITKHCFAGRETEALTLSYFQVWLCCQSDGACVLPMRMPINLGI